MNDDELKMDAIADEFEAAWRTGHHRPSLRKFLARVEPRLQQRLASFLIPLDIEYRRKAGEPVGSADYCELGEGYEVIAQRAMGHSGLDAGTGNLDLTLDTGDAQQEKAKPGTDEPATTRPAADVGRKSQQIGPYKLLQKLGEGGMGTVWMAEQTVPVKRRVALKVIKAGLDNKQVIARFEAERQALAMMNHENIARILDGGTTETGQPYFVMELVQGIPFTKYCDQHKLSIKDRLELFIPVCKAIQHAHQKGIIHRDLKPSNVLVSLYDGKPVPKVIDFGLAKALEHTTHLTDKTMFTEFGQVVGTLQYMSPEQAEMNQLDIDTRTDIYSLGVMLYELLTGSTPIEAETLKKNAILQVLATIRETDPPRPSARLSSSTNEAVSGISSQRQIDPGKLKNILLGELDWIVMKSIEKDRSRRYETANNFAEDISNYLSGEVVSARPPSTSYRIQKYIRRNKAIVATTSAFLAIFVPMGVLAIVANSGRQIANVRAEAELEKRTLAEINASELKRALAKAEIEREQAMDARKNEAEAKERAEEYRNEALLTRNAAEEAHAIAKESARQSVEVARSLVWSQFKSTKANSWSTVELAGFRKLLKGFSTPSNLRTLGAVEYRLRNYQLAIDTCIEALNSTVKEGNQPGLHPIDLAVIAMSHFELGHTDDANKFRAQFEEAMKHEKFKDDAECLSFAEEVKALFDVLNGEKQDQEPQAGQTRDPDGDKQDEQ